MVAKKYSGPWLIVDNGYLRWSTTVPPIKLTVTETERRWSHWCESLRKDVECTFGILKGRWRVLKTGVRLQGMETANNIWLTCCALHNWLLEVDGLDGEWDGALGQLEADDVMRHVPFAMQRLELGFDPRDYDESGLGPGDDQEGMELVMHTDNIENIAGDDAEHNEDSVRLVRHLSLLYFRSKLIEHFDILFKRNELVWPMQRSRTN